MGFEEINLYDPALDKPLLSQEAVQPVAIPVPLYSGDLALDEGLDAVLHFVDMAQTHSGSSYALLGRFAW